MIDDDGSIGHIISTEGGNPKVCPKCGKGPGYWEVRNYDMMWHDGEIYCECGEYIRRYDAG